ncbi:ribokinase [bacterium]|nr:ribokinase [bacterium]NUP93655.1 ribokinase [Candidatus Omnitrophota bacterium]
MTTRTTTPSIIVTGSANLDFCVSVPRLPQRGETLIGEDMHTFFGGKGANQAIAAARLGGDVGFIAKLGDDAFGAQYLRHLRHEGIDTSCVSFAQNCPTGTAQIIVEELGQNMIVVSPSANMRISLSDLHQAEHIIAAAGILLLQMEIPQEIVEGAIRIANRQGVQVILNPSPVDSRFQFKGLEIDYLVVNVVEAETITGITCRDLQTLSEAAECLVSMGARNVVITRGRESTLVDCHDTIEFVPTIHVDSVDAVGAGDTFAGAFAVALTEKMDIISAVRFANCAGALATTRLGAQAAMPFRAEVEECLTSNLDMAEKTKSRMSRYT